MCWLEVKKVEQTGDMLPRTVSMCRVIIVNIRFEEHFWKRDVPGEHVTSWFVSAYLGPSGLLWPQCPPRKGRNTHSPYSTNSQKRLIESLNMSVHERCFLWKEIFAGLVRGASLNFSVLKLVNIYSYQRLVRTSNDVEGYDPCLNKRWVTCHPPIYKLLEVIHSEGPLVELSAKQVSTNADGKTRSKNTSENQARLTTLSERYRSDDISISEFLLIASDYAPFWM